MTASWTLRLVDLGEPTAQARITEGDRGGRSNAPRLLLDDGDARLDVGGLTAVLSLSRMSTSR